MERFNFIKILCIETMLVFFLEIVNFSFVRNYLLSETKVISYLISKECGLSNSLMNYIKDKDYQFIYDENNLSNIGEIVSYTLIKESNSIFIQKKEIVIKQSLVLGLFI